MIESPVTVSLNASTFTAVKLPSDQLSKSNNTWNPVSAYTNPKTNWHIATDESGTDAVLIFGEDGDKYNNQRVPADVDGTIFWAKASSGTPNLIVHVGLEPASRNWK